MRKKQKGWKQAVSLVLVCMFLFTGCGALSDDALAEAMQSMAPEKTTDELQEDGKTKEDLNLRLEDDFYGYYGYDKLMSWELGNEMEYDSFSVIREQVKKEIDGILDEVLAEDAEWEPGSAEYEMAETYKLLMDMDTRNKAGITAIEPAIEAIQSAKDMKSLIEAWGFCYQNYGVFLGIPLTIDKSIDSDSYELYISQPNFIYAVKDLAGDNNASYKSQLRESILNMLLVWGHDKKEVEVDARQIAEMLTDIALVSMDNDTLSNYFDFEHLSKTQFAQLLSNIDTDAMLECYGLDQADSITLQDRACAEKLNQWLTDENLDEFKTYSLYQLYSTFSIYCDSAHRDPFVKGDGRVSDEKIARDTIKEHFGEEISYLWSQKYCAPEAKEYVENLAHEIHSEMITHIKAQDWMSSETKQGALLKMDKMGICVAYPDEWENGYTYTGYEVKAKQDGGDLLTETINNMLFDKQKMEKRLFVIGTAEDTDWMNQAGSITEQNCFYAPQNNNIYILAGFMREPFFSLDYSDEQNLGGIGMVIGHEITHGFDLKGSRFDADGLYNKWWTKEDREHFEAACKKVEDYYDTYGIMDIYHVNGEKTVTENTADLGGLSLVSDVCSDNPEKLKEMYKQYVNVWIGLITEDDLVYRLNEDVHSPAEARINAVLSNTDKFYEAFDINPGDGMYVPEEDRVDIW